jgi:dihydropteroate synthase
MKDCKVWKLRTRSLELGRLPLVMGILNVTPDSFSDGGRYQALENAVQRAVEMEKNGAAIIDIGGESTRPYSYPVDAIEEMRRVLPVVKQLAGKLTIPISIDTSKASVAAAAIEAGAEIINDVTGLEGDPAMPNIAASSQAAVCVMHMQGIPQTMQDNPMYEDCVAEIRHYLTLRLRFCLEAGIEQDRICLDPGIGFGKTHEHNLQLLRSCGAFLELGCPILIGHSRKGFIAHVLGDKSIDRMAGTLGVSIAMAAAGMHVLRVHDVAETVQAFKLFQATSAPTNG